MSQRIDRSKAANESTNREIESSELVNESRDRKRRFTSRRMSQRIERSKAANESKNREIESGDSRVNISGDSLVGE